MTYTYDAPAAFGIGRLTGITDPSGGTAFTYDERGNVVTDTRTINSVAFTTSYAYDLADNVTAVTYPSGRIVSYLRDSLGRVSEVKSRPNAGGTDVSLASNIAYKPFGPVKGLTYGNALVLARTFDQDYRLTAQSVTAGTNTAQDLSYAYNVASFITAGNDNRPTAVGFMRICHGATLRRMEFSLATSAESSTARVRQAWAKNSDGWSWDGAACLMQMPRCCEPLTKLRNQTVNHGLH